MEIIVYYEISETIRGKKQITIDRKYKFSFSYKKNNNSKIYRCTHYKTAYKCKSFIILNEDNKIIKYYNNHNHLEEDYNATISLLKHEINKSSRDETSLGMKPKYYIINIFKKIERYCPSYKSVRIQMMRKMNKHYLFNIKTFDEIPDESKIFKTIKRLKFLNIMNS